METSGDGRQNEIIWEMSDERSGNIMPQAIPVDQVAFSLRTIQLVEENHWHTLEEIAILNKLDLLELPGFSELVVNEIEETLSIHGLSLATEKS